MFIKIAHRKNALKTLKFWYGWLCKVLGYKWWTLLVEGVCYPWATLSDHISESAVAAPVTETLLLALN